MTYMVLDKRGYFWCIMGALRDSSAPHDSLHSAPFYLKGPWTAATGKPTETRGFPGCNDQSKDHPSAHERRITPPQDLSFRYQWDSVSRSRKTSKLCMLHSRPCGTPTPTTHQLSNFKIPEKTPRYYLNCKIIPLITLLFSTPLSFPSNPRPQTYLPTSSATRFAHWQDPPGGRPMETGPSSERPPLPPWTSGPGGWQIRPRWGDGGESDSKRSLFPGTALSPRLCLFPNPFTIYENPK